MPEAEGLPRAVKATASGIDRRQLLRCGAALGLAAAAGYAPLSLAAARRGLIDVHCHIAPPTWSEAMEVVGSTNPGLAGWSVQKLLADMEAGGVETAVVSVGPPQVSTLGKPVAARIAREANEFARRMVADHPGRFGIFATLPLPHVEETLREIGYAFDTLHVDGVAIMTSYDQRWLGDPSFARVWEELNRRKAVVYVHPTVPNCCGGLVKGVPDFVVEVAADTTRAISSIILNGTSQTYPDIDWIWSHGGGVLTSVAERLLVQAVQRAPASGKLTRELVQSELQRFFYDTAQITSSVTLDSLSKLVPVSQIVFGTDAPFRSMAEHTRGIRAFFKGDDLGKVERENAARLLPGLK